MSAILLILNIGLILVGSACVLACLQLRGKTAYLIAAYVVSYADIVLVLEVAGLLSAIRAGPVLALQILLTAVSVLIWVRMGRPPLLGPFAGLGLPRLNLQSLLDTFRQSPLPTSLVLLLAASVGYVYLRYAELILVVPPDNWDSLTYHLSRIGYWLQYHSFYPWPSPFLNQTTLPMNAELGFLWTILWWGTDQLAGFVQWITVPVIALGIYGLVRLLGGDRGQGVLAGLLWPTLTQVLYQSSTTQNDLVSASFCVATLYFFIGGWRATGESHTYLSGLALGLAVGTKPTSLLVLPGLLSGTMLIMWLRRREKEFKYSVFRWLAACALGVFLFGSYVYLQNTIAFGSPLGPLGAGKGPTDLATVDLSAPDLPRNLIQLLRDNSGRYVYQLVDFSPLPGHVALGINPFKAAMFSSIFNLLHIAVENTSTVWNGRFSPHDINPLNQDEAWFGPLGAVLMLAVIYQSYQAARHRDTTRLTLVLVAIGYLSAHSALQLWTSYNGRYYLIPIALASPLVASFLDTHTPGRRVLASFLVLLGLTVMFTVTLTNTRLQGISWRKVAAATRQAPAWTSEFNYRMISENVPSTASLGVVSARDFRDYPFFGEHFTRPVTLAIPDDRSIWPRGDLGRYASDFERSDFLFIVGVKSHFIQDLASNAYDLLSVYDGNSIWIRKELRSSNECDDRKWPFTDFYQSSSSAVCSRFPLVRPWTASRFVETSFLRTGRYIPVIGVGPSGKFEFSLLVKEPTTAEVGIQVEPLGAGSHTLQLVLSAEGSEPMNFSGSFDTQQVLEYDVPLQPALYTVQLGLADGGEASIQRFQVTTPSAGVYPN